MYGNAYQNENEAQKEGEPKTAQNQEKTQKKLLSTPVIIALIAGISAIICVSIFSGSLTNYKKYSGGSGITVTGSASCDFESDLIVWRGSFFAYGQTPKTAYKSIKSNADVIKDYLLENGIEESELSFSSVSISQRWVTEYNDDGKRIGEYLDGYDLSQTVTVTSEDVDKVDAVSRDITKLLEANIEFESDSPEYYYTKLDALKLDLIEQATANAKARVDIIVDGTKSHTTKLLSANLGVFQIIAQNSNSEYSYGGAFDTRSRNKTATITVKLNYATN